MPCGFSEIGLVFCSLKGGWREREKAREESWGPPRGDGNREEGGELEREEREDMDRFRERRPQR